MACYFSTVYFVTLLYRHFGKFLIEIEGAGLLSCRSLPAETCIFISYVLLKNKIKLKKADLHLKLLFHSFVQIPKQGSYFTMK